MKILILSLFLAGCATAPTPEQLALYSNIAHQAAQNAIQDYKTIRPLVHQ